MLKPTTLLLGALALLLAGCNKERTAYALTEDGTEILKFDINKPKTIQSTATVACPDSGETLQQIDYRRSNGQLYGITSENFVAIVDPDGGTCTHVGSTQYYTATDKTFLMDVNPVGDYLRVVSSDGLLNYEVNADTGVLITQDNDLVYATNDANQGVQPQIAGIAHNNNTSGTTSTTLYVLDYKTQSLATTNGVSGAMTTLGGSSGVGHQFTANAGFDIVPNDNKSWVLLSTPTGGARVLTVDLTGGTVSDKDQLGDGTLQVRSLAVSLDEPKDFSN